MNSKQRRKDKRDNPQESEEGLWHFVSRPYKKTGEQKKYEEERKKFS